MGLLWTQCTVIPPTIQRRLVLAGGRLTYGERRVAVLLPLSRRHGQGSAVTGVFVALVVRSQKQPKAGLECVTQTKRLGIAGAWGLAYP